MSVLLEAGVLDVLLMALIGHCISLQLCKYLIRISFSLLVNFRLPLCGPNENPRGVRELRSHGEKQSSTCPIHEE